MKLTTIDNLTARIVRNLPVTREPDPVDMVEWVKEALRQIDAYEQFDKRTVVLDVEEYGAKLPMDFYSIDSDEQFRPFQIRGDKLYIDYTKTGTYELPYLAFPLDEDGNMLIPDMEEALDALMWYVASKLCYLKIIIPSTELNADKCHQKWLQKKLEARGAMRLGDVQSMQNQVNNQNSMRYNKNPLWSKTTGIKVKNRNRGF